MKKLLIRFGTVGSIIDMMRYDKCFPATEEDSGKICRAQMGGGKRTGLDYIVALFTVDKTAPTVGRWESHGCQVLAVGTASVNREYERLVQTHAARDAVIATAKGRKPAA